MFHHHIWVRHLLNSYKILTVNNGDQSPRYLASHLKASRSFLLATKHLFRSIQLFWSLNFGENLGAECGFVSGALLGLQSEQNKIVQRIFQRRDHAFTMVLERQNLQVEKLADSVPLIIVDFGSKFSYHKETNSVRLADERFFLTPNVVYGLVGSNFDYQTRLIRLFKAFQV